MSRTRLPARASVLIIGGGVIGLSAAYHLAAAGTRDVVLIERDALGSGSTCKAAGGVRAQFSDQVNIELARRSLAAFESFETDFGQPIDLHQVGYLFLLDNDQDASVFARNVERQNDLGVPSRMLDVAVAKRLSPWISTEGLVAAAYSPQDGHCTPESVVGGYASAARRLGARLVTGCEVTSIDVTGGQIVAVGTSRGRIMTDTVLCAAGAWSRQVGAYAGVELPVTPLRRQLLISDAVPDLDPETPFTIDFSSSFYFHREGCGFLYGMSDPDETPGFDQRTSDAWLERLAPAMLRRAPSIAGLGVVGGWAGLYEMTPDHNALIGEARGVSRFLYATGFSGHGFMLGPAVGEVVRDLVLGRSPSVDVTGLDARRFETSAGRPELNII